MKPLARRSDLEEQWVDRELVLYDLRTDNAHCLNATAARVRELADGQRTVEEIHQTLKEEGEPDLELDIVLQAVEALADADLLDVPRRGARVSRRRAVRNVVAVTAIGSLFVRSILAPTPAQAQSPTNGNGPPV